jgi:hypothetical protein
MALEEAFCDEGGGRRRGETKALFDLNEDDADAFGAVGLFDVGG